MESLLNFDTELFLYINNLHMGEFEQLLVVVRHGLTWIPLYLGIIFYMIFKWRNHFWVPLLFTLATVAVSDSVSSQLIKKTVRRDRPCRALEEATVRVRCGVGFSFPSSHATNHNALAFFWIFLFSFWGRKRWLFLGWAVLIGFAQIFVGVHYPVDVLTGLILGALIGTLMFRFYQWGSQKIYPNVRL